MVLFGGYHTIIHNSPAFQIPDRAPCMGRRLGIHHYFIVYKQPANAVTSVKGHLCRNGGFKINPSGAPPSHRHCLPLKLLLKKLYAQLDFSSLYVVWIVLVSKYGNMVSISSALIVFIASML
jgi:hypothetical protein